MDTIETTYQQTLEYLYSFIDYSLQRNFKYNPELFDLSRMRDFMTALGNPQEKYQILHITGTKGKGSVSAMCASALQAAGYKTGLYTSPHLDDYAERIQIDGQPIEHEALIALVEEMKPVILSIPRLTTFEITTGLAYLYFALQGVQAAVIEVGLGGRLDATNTCDPLVTAITSISYDHMQVLGNTLTAIAGEKAGILKPGIPAVIAPQVDEAWQTIEEIAQERNVPLTLVGRDCHYERLDFSLDGQAMRIWGENPDQDGKFEISLHGAHQVDNAATAVSILRIARERGLDSLTETAIYSGLKQTHWPGRFEVLHLNPALVVDSAHNRDSALKLRKTVAEYFPGKNVHLIFGASEDKDISGMFAELLPCLTSLTLVKSFHPRAADPETLVTQAEVYGKPVEIIPDVADAVLSLTRRAGPDDLILVAGSIFVAAGARIAWLTTGVVNEKPE